MYEPNLRHPYVRGHLFACVNMHGGKGTVRRSFANLSLVAETEERRGNQENNLVAGPQSGGLVPKLESYGEGRAAIKSFKS